LLHLLKLPIFDKIRLAVSIHDTTKESDFTKQVCMMLIRCLLLPTVVVAKHPLQTRGWWKLLDLNPQT